MYRYIVIFLLFTTPTFAQELLEGTIVDKETGKPVPFASIGVWGTAQGTSSNLNGEFSISVTLPVTLKITCIGYATLILENPAQVDRIELRPVVVQLNTVLVTSRKFNAQKIMRKVFSNTRKNYSNHGFMQQYFYRHYCKDNNSYGRLIEAYVDVWKNRGYKSTRKKAGDHEEIRITQLRRSLDKTVNVLGHEPISVGNILEADLVGYQTPEKSNHMSFYTEVSNLEVDFLDYTFNYRGITVYDGKDVFLIDYAYKRDSVMTTTGAYYHLTETSGTLFISTDTYAILKSEDVKKYAGNTIRTSAYYRKYGDHYYSYHLVRDGETITSDSSRHEFHIEMMSVEIKESSEAQFKGSLPNRDELLAIPYDSAFWSANTILKTTPLENEIIQDLGGGASLTKQFEQYHEYEMNVRNGGVDGEKKLSWLLKNSKGNRIFYLVFWNENFIHYLAELELAKQLHQQYQNNVTFVFVSLDENKSRWEQTVKQYNFLTDGIINYQIGRHSEILQSLGVKDLPGFVLIDQNGEYDNTAKHPSDPLLDNDLEMLIKGL